ncbi:MAG TPA: response regulator [Acetobacteraceae bacterium]|jgi:CheY-like chemotaxis protein
MPAKLLVIDDQPGIGAIVARIAASLGLDTQVVGDPMQAIEAFVSFSPDAVVLDLVMPEKDGIELLEEMILTGHPAMFIIMSGYGEAYLRLAEGVARFHGIKPPIVLRKPFDRAELTELLRSVRPLGPTTSA